MNDKQIKIIESAIHLFAKQGYYVTSVQQIADASGISKGSFYLHFHSKEDLLFSIFKYHYEKIIDRIKAIGEKNLSPREIFMRQLHAQFKEAIANQDFFTMIYKEQSLTLTGELFDFNNHIRAELQKWYEESFLAIYGEGVKPFIIDLVILFEGIRSNFELLLVLDEIKIEQLGELSKYLLRRLDNLVEGLAKEKKPLLTMHSFASLFHSQDQTSEKDKVNALLLHMQETLNTLVLPKEQKETLLLTIDLLLSEIKKETIRPFLFQGMLVHFKNVHELESDCKKIAACLKITLI